MKRYLNLLDRFALVANAAPQGLIERDLAGRQSGMARQVPLPFTTRRFGNPIEALNALAPFEHRGCPNKVLFFQGRNGTWCVVTNSYPFATFDLCTFAKERGYDALSVLYSTRPWDYHVSLDTAKGVHRRIVSVLHGGTSPYIVNSGAPLEFEDAEVIKKLKRCRPVGRGEIAKFCQLFGWPLPVSRAGLEFITESVLYDLTPMPNRTWVDAETASLITLVPPAWVGDEDVLAEPEPDPEFTKREALRRKWNKFRRLLTAALKEKLGPIRTVLVLPKDGIERHNDPAEAWVELIAPDDAMSLKDLEDQVIGDAMVANSFFAEVEVHGVDPQGNVFAVLEIVPKPPGESQEWRINFVPGAEVRASAYTQDPEQGRERQLVDVQSLYG